MSHPFFDKFLVALRSPVIFGDVSETAAAAVWGGISKSNKGSAGPKSPIGTSDPTQPSNPDAPVDPNHPSDPPQSSNPPSTPVQTVETGTDPNTSSDVSRKITLTYEVAVSDAPPGTTYKITVEAWARGDPNTGTREIKTFGTVNGQEVVVTLTETDGHVTGWHVDGLEVADGTNVEVTIGSQVTTASPVDPISGTRPESPSSEFTSTLNGTAAGGSVGGDVPSTGGWGVTDAGNGPSGQGSDPATDGSGGPGGVVPGDAPISTPNDPGVATGVEEIGRYLRFGYPKPQQVYGGNGGGVIIDESTTNWPVPGSNEYVWSSVWTGGYDEEGNPIYTQDWAWQPYFSVGGIIYRWWVIGGPHDPAVPGSTPVDIGTIDLGGPVQLDESNPEDLSGNLKHGPVQPPTKPTHDPFDPTPVAPSVTEPKTVPNKPVDPPSQVAANYLPMEEYPMTKDIVIRSSLSLDAPTETASPSEDAEEVLLDYTGFSFVSGVGATFEETVRFKHLPLHARVEDQSAGNHGFYTAVVGPFTGARFRELVEGTGARVELFWDGPNQPFILFRKMPTRTAPLGTSTAVFQDNVSSEYSRDVTINWALPLPVPFGLGYKYDETSQPAAILKRRMMSPNEPNMEDGVDIDHYDFGALEPMSWEFEKLFKTVLSDGKAIVWRSDVSHEISFE